MEVGKPTTCNSDVSPLKNVTPDDIYNTIWRLKQSIAHLASLLANCHLTQAEVAVLPRHYVDEDGNDSTFDEVESITLERMYNKEALAYYLDVIGFQKRNEDLAKEAMASLSQRGARRAVGIVHLSAIVDGREQEIRDAISNINNTKKWIGRALREVYPKKMDRSTKFYRKLLPEFAPRSITRLIHIADPNVCRVHLSWLASGYTQEKMTRDEVITLIERKNNELLQATGGTSGVNTQDIANIGYFDKYYRIVPSKLHPRCRETINLDGRKRQLPPKRAVIPLLVLSKSPLLGYTPLRDLTSVGDFQPSRNKGVVERIVVSQRLGIYAMKSNMRLDDS